MGHWRYVKDGENFAQQKISEDKQMENIVSVFFFHFSSCTAKISLFVNDHGLQKSLIFEERWVQSAEIHDFPNQNGPEMENH